MKCFFLCVVLALSSCAYLGSPQGQALIADSESIARTAVQAAASHYAGPIAGKFAAAGLDALASVLQGYIGSHVPSSIVLASPGIKGVGGAVAPLIDGGKPVTQSDVAAVSRAAAIARGGVAGGP